MTQLKIQYRKPSDLIPYEGNARTHTDAQVHQIARSIDEFGFTNPILVDGNGMVIAGHGRLLAAQLLQLEKVPVIVLGHLSDRQRKALTLADNKLALNAGWDMAKLGEELSELVDSEMDLDVLGFDEQELDALLKDDLSILPGDDFTPVATGPIINHQPRIIEDKEEKQEEQEDQPKATQPPQEFKNYDEELRVDFRCPSCGHEWSGKPK